MRYDVVQENMELAIPTAVKIASITAKIGRFAVERWSTYRRDQFFESLLENLQIEQASGEQRQEVDDALDYLLEDEQSSEVLFDAYRRVCFSKTKKYGPRIIGLLTAELLNDSRTSDEDEEMIFAAAELLGDVEFSDFRHCYESLLREISDDQKLMRRVMASGAELIEISSEDSHEVGSHRDSEANLLPPGLRSTHGAWAALLQSCGLIYQSVVQQTRQIPEDGERGIDYDQTWVTTVVSVTYKPALRRLYDLLLRAKNQDAQQDAP